MVIEETEHTPFEEQKKKDKFDDEIDTVYNFDFKNMWKIIIKI